MDRARTERIETAVDRLAAAAFSGAVGFAVLQLLGVPAACGAAAAAFAGAALALRRVGAGDERFELAAFVLATHSPEVDELLLTEADRLESCAGLDEPLLLDDVLAEVAPDSRVVRLFDAARMPTPGELNARIERHLDGNGPAAPSDASQALYDALSELRQSLR